MQTYVITNVTGIKMKRLNGNTCSFPYAIPVLSPSVLQDTVVLITRCYRAVRCVLYLHLYTFFIGMIKIGGDAIAWYDRWIEKDNEKIGLIEGGVEVTFYFSWIHIKDSAKMAQETAGRLSAWFIMFIPWYRGWYWR